MPDDLLKSCITTTQKVCHDYLYNLMFVVVLLITLQLAYS